MNNIILVGFMGTGKSAVGRLLSRRLNRPFLDLDEQIAKEAGRSIPEIFASEGEAGFRKRESDAVAWSSGLKNYLIATGGGVMLDEGNVQRLKKSGVLICLSARPDIIVQRTLSTLPSRPLLSNGPDPREKVEELLNLRAPFYALADRTVDTSDRSVEQVVEEILKEIEEWKFEKR
ncbi:MAG: shikimate kinase [Candidatus Omnitrophica bacterium]|nr:shikimate kinase [Candidatus Omnitrophota bacterium]